MTAIRGPFIFCSDNWFDEVNNRWRDALLIPEGTVLSYADVAGCRSIAVLLGRTPRSFVDKARQAGLQIIGWGVAGSPESTVQRIRDIGGIDVWMPQAESESQFWALAACLDAGVIACPVETVMTSGGMEPWDGRRITKLREHGADNCVWVETYLQDARRPGSNPALGDVNAMRDHFVNNYGFREAHPVIGTWDGVFVSEYDLSKHGRNFGVWRLEQGMDWVVATDMAKVPALQTPTPPPPKPEPTMTNDAPARNAQIAEITQTWLDEFGPAPLTRMALMHDISTRPDTFRQDIRDAVDGKITGMRAENAALKDKVADLERRIAAAKADLG